MGWNQAFARLVQCKPIRYGALIYAQVRKVPSQALLDSLGGPKVRYGFDEKALAPAAATPRMRTIFGWRFLSGAFDGYAALDQINSSYEFPDGRHVAVHRAVGGLLPSQGNISLYGSFAAEWKIAPRENVMARPVILCAPKKNNQLSITGAYAMLRDVSDGLIFGSYSPEQQLFTGGPSSDPFSPSIPADYSVFEIGSVTGGAFLSHKSVIGPFRSWRTMFDQFAPPSSARMALVGLGRKDVYSNAGTHFCATIYDSQFDDRNSAQAPLLMSSYTLSMPFVPASPDDAVLVTGVQFANGGSAERGMIVGECPAFAMVPSDHGTLVRLAHTAGALAWEPGSPYPLSEGWAGWEDSQHPYSIHSPATQSLDANKAHVGDVDTRTPVYTLESHPPVPPQVDAILELVPDRSVQAETTAIQAVAHSIGPGHLGEHAKTVLGEPEGGRFMFAGKLLESITIRLEPYADQQILIDCGVENNEELGSGTFSEYFLGAINWVNRPFLVGEIPGTTVLPAENEPRYIYPSKSHWLIPKGPYLPWPARSSTPPFAPTPGQGGQNGDATIQHVDIYDLTAGGGGVRKRKTLPVGPISAEDEAKAIIYQQAFIFSKNDGIPRVGEQGGLTPRDAEAIVPSPLTGEYTLSPFGFGGAQSGGGVFRFAGSNGWQASESVKYSFFPVKLMDRAIQTITPTAAHPGGFGVVTKNTSTEKIEVEVSEDWLIKTDHIEMYATTRALLKQQGTGWLAAESTNSGVAHIASHLVFDQPSGRQDLPYATHTAETEPTPTLALELYARSATTSQVKISANSSQIELPPPDMPSSLGSRLNGITVGTFGRPRANPGGGLAWGDFATFSLFEKAFDKKNICFDEEQTQRLLDGETVVATQWRRMLPNTPDIWTFRTSPRQPTADVDYQVDSVRRYRLHVTMHFSEPTTPP